MPGHINNEPTWPDREGFYLKTVPVAKFKCATIWCLFLFSSSQVLKIYDTKRSGNCKSVENFYWFNIHVYILCILCIHTYMCILNTHVYIVYSYHTCIYCVFINTCVCWIYIHIYLTIWLHWVDCFENLISIYIYMHYKKSSLIIRRWFSIRCTLFRLDAFLRSKRGSRMSVPRIVYAYIIFIYLILAHHM